MTTAAAPQIGVCLEYRLLLDQCQKALADWQQRRTLTERTSIADNRASEDLKRLQANYAHTYALLESHEHSCRTCQYVSKIAGLDFDSLANALNRDPRFT